MTYSPDILRLADGPEAVVLALPSLGLGAEDLWGPVSDLVGHRLTVIGVELPGHGRSARTSGPLAIEELADAAVAASVIPKAPYVVAGVSIGGLIAQAAAVRHQDLVSALLLCNTLPRIATAQDWGARATTVAEHGLASQVEGARTRWWGSRIKEGRPETVRRLSEKVTERDPESYLGLYAALGAFDGWAALPSLRLPVRLIAGSEDGPTPASAMAEMAEALPDARIDILDGIGHQAPLEAPERVAAALLELVERDSRTRGPDHAAQ